MLYFEDIEVGRAKRYGHYPVTRDEVIAFAEKYDAQPFHLSDEGAAGIHFGRLAASGWQTCAMMMAMNVAAMKDEAKASLGAAGIDELRWLKPVYPGDTLRAESLVLDKRASKSRPEMGIVRNQITVFNQDDVPVLRLIGIEMIGTRPAGS